MTIRPSARLVLALALATFAALATVAAAQTSLSVLSHGFIVQVPDGWNVDDEGDANDALFFVTSPDHGGGLVIAAGPLDGPEAAAYQASGLAGLADLSFDLVSSVPGVQRGDLVRDSVAGVEAAGFRYSGTELGGRFVYFVAGERIYALGAIADAAAAQAMDAALADVLASFQFVAMGFPEGGPDIADAFVGTFSGDGLSLTLMASEGGYVGSLTFSGQTYPAQASATSERSLAGTFVSGGTGFGFDLVLDGDTRVFTTGTSRYVLRR